MRRAEPDHHRRRRDELRGQPARGRRRPGHRRVRDRVGAAGRSRRCSTSARSAPAAARSPGSTTAARCASARKSAGADPGPACYGRGGDAADGHRRQPRARPHRPDARRQARARRRRRRGGDPHASPSRSGCPCSTAPRGSPRSSARTWRSRSGWSPPTAAATRATTRWSPSAAPAGCTRTRSRAPSASTTSLVPPFAGVACAFGATTMDVRHDLERTFYAPLPTTSTSARSTTRSTALEDEVRALLERRRRRRAATSRSSAARRCATSASPTR